MTHDITMALFRDWMMSGQMFLACDLMPTMPKISHPHIRSNRGRYLLSLRRPTGIGQTTKPLSVVMVEQELRRMNSGLRNVRFLVHIRGLMDLMIKGSTKFTMRPRVAICLLSCDALLMTFSYR